MCSFISSYCISGSNFHYLKLFKKFKVFLNDFVFEKLIVDNKLKYFFIVYFHFRHSELWFGIHRIFSCPALSYDDLSYGTIRLYSWYSPGKENPQNSASKEVFHLLRFYHPDSFPNAHGLSGESQWRCGMYCDCCWTQCSHYVRIFVSGTKFVMRVQ